MARLKHVSRSDLAIERRRRGRGYAFVDAGGKPYGDAEFRSRAKHLAIPPAWREVHLKQHLASHFDQLSGIHDEIRAGEVLGQYSDWF
ncbi:MAG: hypothetical protein EOP20_10955 [Hyphomicrobiales bacterium]|nr:MAG: hypothetical protein EOP20_10955 [Hyphomicrobiales bacterium]